MNTLSRTLPMILSVAAFCLSLIFFFRAPYAVVTFDEKEIRGLLVRQLAEHAASNEQALAASARLKKHLSQTLADYATAHHVVVVDSHAILAGKRDITREVISLLSKASRGAS